MSIYQAIKLKEMLNLSNYILATYLLDMKSKASVTIMADFSPEFNPPFRWRSKHQTKNDC